MRDTNEIIGSGITIPVNPTYDNRVIITAIQTGNEQSSKRAMLADVVNTRYDEFLNYLKTHVNTIKFTT